MDIRTDLAIEKLEIAGEILPEGVLKSEDIKEGVKITKISIKDQKASNILGKPVGEYITLDIDNLKVLSSNFEGHVSIISDQIKSILNKEGLILVVGLGNSDITPDAIGPFCIDSILATRHISGELASDIGLDGLRPVAAIAPSVLGKTGMETAEIIASICNKISPEAVIVIDALASKSVERLGTTIQISDTGISPGSGVQNKRKALSQETLGVPVIAIGIPTVVDMTTIAFDLLGEGSKSEKVSTRGRTMMVTPREIDNLVKQSSKLIGFSINKALQPFLSLEDIQGLAV